MSTSALVLPLGVSIFFVLGCAILVLMISLDYSFNAARSFAFSHTSVIAASGRAHMERYFTNGAVLKHTGLYHAFLSGRHVDPSFSDDLDLRDECFAHVLKAFYGSVSTGDLSFQVPYTPTMTFADGSFITCFRGKAYDELSAESIAATEEITNPHPQTGNTDPAFLKSRYASEAPRCTARRMM